VPRIISTHSFRGGTGKSNTTANLAVMVARTGKRVAVIDTDIQSPGIHVLFNLEPHRVTRSLNDYLWNKCAVEEAAYDVTASCIGAVSDRNGSPRVFLVPSSLNTGEISRILREGYDVAMLNDGFQQLIARLKLDYLFIDTHPGVNEETLLSIAISDVLVLIMRPDNQDMQGTAITVELARRLNVPRMFIVVNKVPAGTNDEILRRDIEQSFQTDVAALLPLNPEVARMASGGIFTNRFPEHPFSRELAIVARKLMETDPAAQAL